VMDVAKLTALQRNPRNCDARAMERQSATSSDATNCYAVRRGELG
jgi:hypothetical protein